MSRLIRPFDLLLDGATGWRPLAAIDAAIADGRIVLQRRQPLSPPLAEPNGSFGGHTLPRGVATWGDEIFVADPDRHRILHWRSCCGPVEPLPTIGGLGCRPRQLNRPLGLTISERDDLVVADSRNRRLLLFTLPGLALRRILGPFPAGGPLPGDPLPGDPEPEEAAECDLPPSAAGDSPRWSPVDVASGPAGRLYVADATGAIWRLDRQGRPDSRYRGRLPAGTVPFRLLVDAEDRVYVVARGRDTVLVLDRFGRLAGEAGSLDDALDPDSKGTLRKRLPAGRLLASGDRVLLTPSGGSPKVTEASLAEACAREPEPTGLILDAGGRLRLEDAPRGPYLLHRPPVLTFPQAGLFQFQPLDGGRAGNPWHRVVVEFSAPERTGIRLFSVTSDVPLIGLEAGGLLRQPIEQGPWQASPDNAGEWLIQSPPGRYLYLALLLLGPGDRTPEVERIYLYAQRNSSLQFLPAIYQQDDASRHLLDRLLSLLDTVFGEIESEIEDFPLYLDADGAPPDFLPWLASWFDLVLLQSWSPEQQRRVLKQIVPLYRWRGTVRGLRLLLQLHANLSEPMPGVVENLRGAGSPALQTWLGEPQEGDPEHHIMILMPAHTIDTAEKRAILERLIDATIPAHAHYTLRPVAPGMRLGSAAIRGSAISLDSVLGSHETWRLPSDPLSGDREQESNLGIGTVLPAPPMPRAVTARLGETRLGVAHASAISTRTNGRSPTLRSPTLRSHLVEVSG